MEEGSQRIRRKAPSPRRGLHFHPSATFVHLCWIPSPGGTVNNSCHKYLLRGDPDHPIINITINSRAPARCQAFDRNHFLAHNNSAKVCIVLFMDRTENGHRGKATCQAAHCQEPRGPVGHPPAVPGIPSQGDPGCSN